jgi:hypothetical protein
MIQRRQNRRTTQSQAGTPSSDEARVDLPSVLFDLDGTLIDSVYNHVFPKWKIHRRVGMSGYAYETIPNKPIIAGHTKGVADESGEETFSPGASLTNPTQSASLGILALAVSGRPLWQRK